MNFSPKDFKNKKIFLTGHTGFKGAWLCVWLQSMGAKVKGYALPPEKSSLYSMIRHELKIDSVYADVLDQEKIKNEIVAFQPDYVFHLAAQALVRASYRFPVETFVTNSIGTANVLDALRFLKKKCICIIVTTDKVYENLERNYAYKESDKLGGYDPYSASKAAAEIVVESYRLSFFNPENFRQHKKSIASVRAGNVIGGGDYAEDRILPDIIRSISESKSIHVRNPQSIRPWQHVLEPLSGYLTLASHMKSNPQKFATAFNFGPLQKDRMNVKQLVQVAIRSWGSGKFTVSKKKSKLHEAELLMLDTSKAKRLLKWSPVWNAETAIRKSINWYLKSTTGAADCFRLCLDDINDYRRSKK